MTLPSQEFLFQVKFFYQPSAAAIFKRLRQTCRTADTDDDDDDTDADADAPAMPAKTLRKMTSARSLVVGC